MFQLTMVSQINVFLMGFDKKSIPDKCFSCGFV